MRNLAQTPHYKKIDRLELLSNIRDKIDIPVKSIFYPFCGADRRLEHIFPDAKIIYVDESAHLLGHTEIWSFTRKYIVWEPEHEHEGDIYDLVMYSRSGIGTFIENVFPRLIPWGYILADNTFEAARNIYESGLVEYIGCEHSEGGWLSSEESIDFLEPVTHDKQWESTPCFNWARQVRRIIHGRYNGIFWDDKPELSVTEWHAHISKHVREMQKNLFKPYDTKQTTAKVFEMPIFQHLSHFPKNLPPKKDSRDDIFLFRKPL